MPLSPQKNSESDVNAVWQFRIYTKTRAHLSLYDEKLAKSRADISFSSNCNFSSNSIATPPSSLCNSFHSLPRRPHWQQRQQQKTIFFSHDEPNDTCFHWNCSLTDHTQKNNNQSTSSSDMTGTRSNRPTLSFYGGPLPSLGWEVPCVHIPHIGHWRHHQRQCKTFHVRITFLFWPQQRPKGNFEQSIYP